MSDSLPLAAVYQRVVQEKLGLVATIDEDGDVLFRHPDLGALFFSMSDKDPEFFRLVYPGFTDAAGLGLTRAQFLEVVNTVNRTSKATKLYIVPREGAPDAERVSAAIEAFVGGPDQAPTEALLRDIAPRSLSAIRFAAEQVIRTAKAMTEAS